MYNFDTGKWKQIYSLPHILKVDNKIEELQYKILHRYVATNKLLYKIGKRDSPRCNQCFLYPETIPHMFYECNVIRNFWFRIEEFLQGKLNNRTILLERDILFRYNNEGNEILENLVNRIILLGKFYIYKNKIKEKEITPLEFIAMLQTKYNINL